jgi:heme exporter protein C
MTDWTEPFVSTSSKGTRGVGAAALVGIALTTVYAFAISKPDSQLGQSVRIMYVHVPAISMAYVAMIANAGFSAYYLWKRSVFADLAAAATGEIGVVLLGLGLVSGSLWGRVSWGVFWRWDARLTTTSLLFLMYVGYLAVRGLPGEPRARGTRAAVIGILSALLIYPVHMSVEWWGSLHQTSTLGANSHIGGNQLFTLFLGFVTAALITVWLAMHRFRVAWLAEQLAEHELADSIEARRAEAGLPGTPDAVAGQRP